MHYCSYTVYTVSHGKSFVKGVALGHRSACETRSGNSTVMPMGVTLLSIGAVSVVSIGLSCRAASDGDTLQRNQELVGTWKQFMEEEGDVLWRDLLAGVDTELAYVVPDATDDGWACADLEWVGLSQEKACLLVRRIASGKYDDLHGFLLVKDRSLVLEEYFGARGRVRGPALRKVFRDKIHHLGSTTKSVTPLLIRIAIDKEMIESVEVPVRCHKGAPLCDQTGRMIVPTAGTQCVSSLQGASRGPDAPARVSVVIRRPAPWRACSIRSPRPMPAVPLLRRRPRRRGGPLPR